MATTSGHTIKAFDEDLDRLRALISQMGGLAEHAIRDSLRCLVQRDLEGARKIVDATISLIPSRKRAPRGQHCPSLAHGRHLRDSSPRSRFPASSSARRLWQNRPARSPVENSARSIPCRCSRMAHATRWSTTYNRLCRARRPRGPGVERDRAVTTSTAATSGAPNLHEENRQTASTHCCSSQEHRTRRDHPPTIAEMAITPQRQAPRGLRPRGDALRHRPSAFRGRG